MRCFAALLCGLSAVSAFMPAMETGYKVNTAAITPSGSQSAVAESSVLSNTQLNAMATSEKLYPPEAKEFPKVFGGVRAALKELVVITGASSGLGLSTTIALANSGDYHVIMACRDTEKAKRVANENGIPKGSYTVMKLELASIQSVRDFVSNLMAFKSAARPLKNLICNAAVYLPKDPEPSFTDDGFEMSMGVNHLGHFLLVNLLLDDMSKAKGARLCIVGSITGNTNTVGGGLVYPRADLGQLQGFEQGFKAPIAMADGKPFFGAKAYKDAKVCNMMTVSELHRRYHEDTGIVFSSMYPGCIAESALFREKREWFRKIFPLFMKYVTGGYVSEKEAGERLAQVIADPKCNKSDVYWSWNGKANTVGYINKEGVVAGAGGSGGEIFENDQSDAVQDKVTAKKMWDLSKKAVGLGDKDMFKGGQLED